MSHVATIELLRERVSPVVGIETRSLASAAGRIAAEPVVAPIDVPGHTNSAVDGYAFSDSSYDRAAGSWFALAGRAAAGRPMAGVLQGGQAARIFTGAVMPEGAESVAMQEDCEVADNGGHARVFVPAGLKSQANVRKAGEDLSAGTEIVSAGKVIRAPEIAAMASVGVPQVRCFARPRIAIVSTGDEIVRGDSRLQAGQVYDVNAPLLASLTSGCPVEITDLGVWPDRFETVVDNLAHAAAKHDLILTSGGASLGEEDHMSTALGQLGSRHVWQIAVKPGRPLMFGQIGDTVVVGLPGNPVAVFVCFLMYVWPLVRRLGGGQWPEPRRFPLKANFRFANRKVGRREFWRGTTRMTPDGLVVEKFPRDGSGLISGLRAADGLIDIPEDVPEVVPGQLVDFIPFSEFGICD